MTKDKMIKFRLLSLFFITFINIMMTLTDFKKILLVLLACVAVSALMGCSDDKSDFDPMDQSKIEPVPDMKKQEFEHEFAEQCVTRELKNSKNPEQDQEGLSKTCLCISKYMMEDLTAQEAEKFLDEHENPESLVIRYDAAAYHCLQENQPKGPDFSRK
jgi:hypothetical protein